VLYAANPSTPPVREAMTGGLLACITTPRQGNRVPEGCPVVLDNGCFGGGYPGDDGWLAWLAARADLAPRALFAVAPDVVADAAATLERSAPFLPTIRALGFPAAFVAQDGLEALPVPWDDMDALFIGGSTAWKLSPAAAAIARQATRRGKWVHMGRVNSRRRWTYAEHIGCDSADGTFLAFGPTRNLPELLGWTSQPGFHFPDEEQTA
jgi:hypothetical protein